MSIVKFLNQKNGGDRGQLYWGRASIDGAPMRSSAQQLPLLKEEEFETRVQRVHDTKVKVFDLAIPEQLLEYQDTLDHMTNEWWIMLYHERQFVAGTNNWKALLIWSEPHMEEVPQGLA